MLNRHDRKTGLTLVVDSFRSGISSAAWGVQRGNCVNAVDRNTLLTRPRPRIHFPSGRFTMTVKTPFPEKKVVRKTSANRRASLRPAATREVMLSPAEIGTPSERTAAFDPRLFLAKLSVGKSKQEYQDDESVFAQ